MGYEPVLRFHPNFDNLGKVKLSGPLWKKSCTLSAEIQLKSRNPIEIQNSKLKSWNPLWNLLWNLEIHSENLEIQTQIQISNPKMIQDPIRILRKYICFKVITSPDLHGRAQMIYDVIAIKSTHNEYDLCTRVKLYSYIVSTRPTDHWSK